MVKNRLLILFGVLLLLSFAVIVHAQIDDTYIDESIISLESFDTKIVEKISSKSKAKLVGTKKYIIRSPYGDYNVDSFEFSKTENCIYTDNNIIICGNFTISLY